MVVVGWVLEFDFVVGFWIDCFVDWWYGGLVISWFWVGFDCVVGLMGLVM